MGSTLQYKIELVAAYNFLRNREAERLYGTTMDEMLAQKEKNQFKKDEKLNKQIETIKLMYPLKLSEAEPKKN